MESVSIRVVCGLKREMNEPIQHPASSICKLLTLSLALTRSLP